MKPIYYCLLMLAGAPVWAGPGSTGFREPKDKPEQLEQRRQEAQAAALRQFQESEKCVLEDKGEIRLYGLQTHEQKRLAYREAASQCLTHKKAVAPFGIAVTMLHYFVSPKGEVRVVGYEHPRLVRSVTCIEYEHLPKRNGMRIDDYECVERDLVWEED